MDWRLKKMQKNNNIRPRWWMLYLILFSGSSLLFVGSRLVVTANLHRFIEIGIVLLTYGLVFVWLSANEQGMINEDREKYRQYMRDATITQLFQPDHSDFPEPVLHTPHDSETQPADHRA